MDDGLVPYDDDVLAAAMALAGRRVAVLTGAGISTESGIPDYRGPETASRARKPMRFAEFTAGDAARRRYWARATLGWPRLRDAVPNAGHTALVDDRVAGVITQNVDGLHTAAGSSGVVELHGALRDVVCLACRAVSSRDDVHRRVLEENAGIFRARHPRTADDVPALAPDGDVDFDDDAVIARFVAPVCSCGGALKPRVVFFGESVDAAVLESAWRVLDDAGALLVVGSSLEVYSGRRFVMRAAERKMPIVIVNATATRADDLATVILRDRAGRVLPALFGRSSVDAPP